MRSFLKKIISSILIWESKLILAKYKPKIVAVTGSVGKTSTKDAIAHVLSGSRAVRKSNKSYNSEIGIPLTIIGCENAWSNPFLWIKNIIEGLALIVFPNTYPEWLVLEVGADRPGDIKHMAAWLTPDVSVITRIGDIPVHVEFFASPAALAKEKSYLASAVKPSGTLILNHDDDVVRAMEEKTKARIMTYGFNEGATLRASNDHLTYLRTPSGEVPEGLTFKVDFEGNILPVRIEGAIGKQVIYAALAALAVGVSVDLPLLPMLERLATFEGPPGRLRLIAGIKETILIDDTYNSSPAAVDLALSTLLALKTKGRKIAVLGDMMELGKFTIDAHKAAGFEVARVADMFFAVGQRAKFIADGALAEGMEENQIHYFDDARTAGQYLQEILKSGDIVLIKGSQYVRMEKTLEEIMAHPEGKEHLLVRQEKEWQNR